MPKFFESKLRTCECLVKELVMVGKLLLYWVRISGAETLGPGVLLKSV